MFSWLGYCFFFGPLTPWWLFKFDSLFVFSKIIPVNFIFLFFYFSDSLLEHRGFCFNFIRFRFKVPFDFFLCWHVSVCFFLNFGLLLLFLSSL